MNETLKQALVDLGTLEWPEGEVSSEEAENFNQQLEEKSASVYDFCLNAGASTGQGIDMPTLEEVKSARSSSNNADADMTETPTEGELPQAGGSSDDVGGGSGGGSGSRGGGSSPGDYYAPEDAGGIDETGQNYCPQSRAENPALYDSCRAGYVPPTIQFGGVTSCYPIDKSRGLWSVSWTWVAVGGNYNGVWNGGPAVTAIHETSPGEASEGPVAWGEISMVMLDMNGWGYKLDEVYGSFGGVQMNTVCR